MCYTIQWDFLYPLYIFCYVLGKNRTSWNARATWEIRTRGHSWEGWGDGPSRTTWGGCKTYGNLNAPYASFQSDLSFSSVKYIVYSAYNCIHVSVRFFCRAQKVMWERRAGAGWVGKNDQGFSVVNAITSPSGNLCLQNSSENCTVFHRTGTSIKHSILQILWHICASYFEYWHFVILNYILQNSANSIWA